jgi:hypothetical protein
LRRALLLVTCGALLLTCCRREEEATAPEGAGEDYFPIAEGNKWVWAGGVLPAAGDTIKWEVRDRTVLETGESVWDVRTERFWEEKGRSIVDSCNVQRKEDLMLLFMSRGDPRPDTVLNYPLRPGKSWTVTHVSGGKIARSSRVAGEEAIETPYGSFEYALRVDSEDRNLEKDTLLMKTTDWYARGVGRVMSRVEARGEVWEMRLVTARLR